MSNENRNDFHWKNKLEDVDGLSGELFTNRNAAWEKLHSRLQKKSAKVRPLWYRAAAACLLLMVILTVLITGNKRVNVLATGPSHSQALKNVLPVILPPKQHSVPLIAASSTPGKKDIRVLKPAAGKRSPVPKIVVGKIVQPRVSVPEHINKITSIPVETTDYVVPEVAAAPAKIKLKVVHINELGDPGEENLNTARFYEHRSFQIKLINHDAFTGPLLPSNNNTFTIFKSKILPSN